MTITLEKLIILDMTKTKEQQKKKRVQRWNGYEIAVIKDMDSGLENLQQVLLKKQILKDMTTY